LKLAEKQHIMGRPKSFDPDVALHQAMKVFWRNGYIGTPMPQLTSAMGLHPGNLYSNFGSKENLFFRSLLLYQKEQRIKIVNHIKQGNDDPLTCLKSLLHKIVSTARADKEFKGCFMVNTFLEINHHSESVKEKVVTYFADIKKTLLNLILEAQKYGQISVYREANALTAMIVNAIVGIQVMLRHPKTVGQSDLMLAELIENLR